MQATTILPAEYRQQATFDLSKSRKAVICAIALGIVLLIGVAWLLVQFSYLLRPTALAGIKFHNILTISADGMSINLPIVDAIIAGVLTIIIHELVHGLFFWWFAKKRPIFGVKGLLPYASASPEVYFPRNQYLIVGIAPFVLLTLAGSLLILVAPVAAVSVLSLLTIFNAAGAAGDLVMAARLLSYSPRTLMQDHDTGVVVYGPERIRA